jgi:potassium-dependent mechanosensitive channel
VDDPRIRTILDQVEAFILLLQRSVVQQQVLAFLLVTLVAWLIPVPYRLFVRWLSKRSGVSEAEAHIDGDHPVTWQIRSVRVLRALEFVLFPIVGLMLGGLVVGFLSGQGIPFGLFERLMRLFWLLLAYRVIIAILYALLNPENARRYQRRFVGPVFAVLFAASLSIGITGTFGEIELFQFMGQALSPRAIAISAAVLYLAFAFAWILRDILSRYVLPRTQADAGVAQTIELVVHYSVIGLGVFMAASILGFDLTALLVIFGGLSVGIGFGLQELIANFISGILLVFEQSLRPGDFVTVEGERGTVTKMKMRATVLRSIDNVEIFIPNKTLLTSNVATSTLTDRVVRGVVNVGVSYDSDPSEVRNLLLAVADRHGLVLEDPAPLVLFVDFGNSSLDFELGVWMDIANFRIVLSDLRFMIFSDFAKHGITIPFPQRDVHFFPAETNGAAKAQAERDLVTVTAEDGAQSDSAPQTRPEGERYDPSRLP